MLFRPKYTIDSIYNLNPQQLKKMGIKAIFSDLDNTLIAWNKKDSVQEMTDFNNRLKKVGIRLVVISNNNNERVGKVLNPNRINFIAKARKPLPIGIDHALKKYNLRKSQVLMVGDQLITDIQAGNLAGVKTVLVKPLVTTDKWNTRINRFFERGIFFVLALHKPIKFKGNLDDGRN